MLLLLPSAWFACFLLFREMTARRWIGPDWRFSFLLASATWGALLTFGTEVLSLATLLNAPAVRLFWLSANVTLWGGLFCWRRSRLETGAGMFASGLKEMPPWPLDARLVM